MNMKYFSSAFLALLCLPAWLGAHPRNIRYQKTLNREFSVGSGASLNLANKYGKVLIHTWDQNRIQATIIITGFGASMDDARHQADRVTIEASQTGNQVSLKTHYSALEVSFWSRLFSWGSSSGKNYVTIDYEVYIPASLGYFHISDQYGDVLAEYIPCKTSLDLGYAHFNLGRIEGPLKLSMDYSSGNLSRAGQVDLNASYSKLFADYLDTLTIHSNYCHYLLDSIGELTLRSNYDEYTIQHAGGIDFSSNYTNYHIGTLDHSLAGTYTYGDLDLTTLSRNFRGVDIRGSYGHVHLGLGLHPYFQLSVVIHYGKLRTGDLKFDHSNQDQEGSQKTFSGFTTGADPKAPSIRFQGDYADLVLNDR